MEKMKTYVITLSKRFMKGHPRAGEPTRFRCKFFMGRAFCDACLYNCGYDGTVNNRSCSRNAIIENGRLCNSPKIHTIRGNFPFWEKRIKEVQEGKAILSIRQWTGEPYKSKQEVLINLSQKDGVGIQKLEYDQMLGWFIDDTDSDITSEAIAGNDGLSFKDWQAWFPKAKNSEPMAIIHFTSFRY